MSDNFARAMEGLNEAQKKLDKVRSLLMETYGPKDDEIDVDVDLDRIDRDIDLAIALKPNDQTQASRKGVEIHCRVDLAKKSLAKNPEAWTPEQRDRLHALTTRLLKEMFGIETENAHP